MNNKEIVGTSVETQELWAVLQHNEQQRDRWNKCRNTGALVSTATMYNKEIDGSSVETQRRSGQYGNNEQERNPWIQCRNTEVRLGYCFTPYQRLWLYNGAPLVAFYDTLGIRRTYSRLKPPASSRGRRGSG